MGVRAQIQHLYAYATKDPLPGADSVSACGNAIGGGAACVDPRFSLVQRGSARTWEGLNGKWAVPGTTYGQSIVELYEQAVAFSTTYKPAPTAPPKTPEEVTVDNGIADGVITDRAHWIGVLIGTITPVPAYIKAALDNAHGKLKG